MAEELNKVMANALPLASNVTDSDMLLMIQNGKNVRRVPPSLMKGKKGDPGDNTYLRYTGQWVQHKLGVNGAWVNLIPVADMRGPSAYALAVENGYKGTEVEWLASLSKASEDAASVALAAAKTAEQTNASVSAVESLRAEAERLRVEAETFRTEAERVRAIAEAARLKEEEKRISGETDREIAETSRKEAETARAEAERLRAEAEAQRAKDSAAAIENAGAATASANTSAAAAQETADHPTYIGADHYVYKWNKETKAYDKTDIFVKGDAFSIKKVYTSVLEMEADTENAEIKEGDFVLINTGDVENPDNARLYIRSSAGFDFLVDMSGAIGFTGKTPQLGIGTVAGGETAAVSLSEAGTDPDGNPKFKLNLVLPQGKKGDTPVLTAGQVTTGAPGTPATAELVPDGMTDAGIPCYRLDLTIPRGDTGRGNVSVPPAALKAGVTYLFKPGADGSAEGEFIEYTAPAQVQSDWNETDPDSSAHIKGKPALKPVATSGSYNDLENKPTEINASKFSEGLKNNGLMADWNDPPLVNGLVWSNSTAANAPSWPYGNVLQISNKDIPEIVSDWSWINQILFGTDNNIYHRAYIHTTGWAEYKRLAHADEIPDLSNLTSNIKFTNAHTTDGSKIGIRGTAGGSDCWSITTYSTAEDGEELEIATGDNGNEPIVARQYYSDPISTPPRAAVRTAYLLDANGNTIFPGDLDTGGVAKSGGVELVKTNDARLSNARPVYSTNIVDGEDLNSFTTPGFYHCVYNRIAETLKNCPTGHAFCLIVGRTADRSCVQFLTTYTPNTADLFYRNSLWSSATGTSTFGDWQRIYTTADKPPVATTSADGLMPAADKAKMDRLQRYAYTTTCNALNVDYEIRYVNLSANDALSVNASGTAYNGRTITAFIYCAAAQTIAIPTTGSYISMCGSSYTCPAGKWVEFNLTCIGGVWHIAKLEQE